MSWRLKRLAHAVSTLPANDERALQTLLKVVQTPVGENYGPLKVQAIFDELRKDPRFDEILKQSQKPFPRL